MVSVAQNERLTRVGPGTPAGEMLRRYWWPVGFADEVKLGGRPVQTRVLGEDLVLFRDGGGRPGALGLHCSHRGTSLAYGRMEEHGLRCPYHGWVYDREGRCLEQPAEPADSSFKDRIRHLAYPAQDVCGLIFIYMGPAPAPSLPKYDLLYVEEGERIVGAQEEYCNWLQRAENGMDECHVGILHAAGYPDLALKPLDPHYQPTWYGFRTDTSVEGSWPRLNHSVFPSGSTMTSMRIGRAPNLYLRYRVPTDDTKTTTYWINWIPGGPSGIRTVGLTHQEPGVFDRVENDWWGIASHDEDRMAQETQGKIADRSVEHLGSSDKGIILFRDMVEQAIQAVERGDDPPGVIRDPNHAVIHFENTLRELEGALSGA